MSIFYLEDVTIFCEHEVMCTECRTETLGVSHHLDSETASWECPECGYINGISMPDCREEDPDDYRDAIYFC